MTLHCESLRCQLHLPFIVGVSVIILHSWLSRLATALSKLATLVLPLLSSQSQHLCGLAEFLV